MTNKKKVATVSLAGCFGCHMSFLDMDLAIIDILESITLDRSPLTDFKSFSGTCDIGLVEGGVCNSENVETLLDFRRKCKILVSMGECAIMGGLPALRNNIPLSECLREAYIDTPTSINPHAIFPYDSEIPEILDKIYPCHEVVKIDYFLPGCPPSAAAIKAVLGALIADKKPNLEYGLLKYD